MNKVNVETVEQIIKTREQASRYDMLRYQLTKELTYPELLGFLCSDEERDFLRSVFSNALTLRFDMYARKHTKETVEQVQKDVVKLNELCKTKGVPKIFTGDVNNLNDLARFTNLQFQKLCIDTIVAFSGRLIESPKKKYKECGKDSIVFNFLDPSSIAAHLMCEIGKDESYYFFFDIPREVASIFTGETKREIYYLDGCDRENLLDITFFCEEFLPKFGTCNWGIGCVQSGDEIIFNPYNMCRINSQNIHRYKQLTSIADKEDKEGFIDDWNLLAKLSGLKTSYHHKCTETEPMNTYRMHRCSKLQYNKMSIDDVLEKLKPFGLYLAEKY